MKTPRRNNILRILMTYYIVWIFFFLFFDQLIFAYMVGATFLLFIFIGITRWGKRMTAEFERYERIENEIAGPRDMRQTVSMRYSTGTKNRPL